MYVFKFNIKGNFHLISLDAINIFWGVKYELLIFDLDGTLIDTRQDITNSANEMLAFYGLEAKCVDEITAYVGDGIAKLVERCIDNHPIDLEEAVSIFKRSYAGHLLDFTKPYPGIIDLLKRLEGVSKAILTNKAYDMSKTITDGLGLTGYFEVFVGGDTLSRRKPSPDGIHFILEKTGTPNERALLIGDGRNDLLTARSAGVQSVYVSWGFSDHRDVEELKPEYVIDQPEELLAIVQAS